MRIGFIGLGAMGRHMAANLQRAGHELQVYDLRQVEGFSNWKNSAAEAARGCEVLFTSLPGPTEVETVGQQVEGPLTWFMKS
jgi:3-hydroxyisobutyrate dehydrogenase